MLARLQNGVPSLRRFAISPCHVPVSRSSWMMARAVSAMRHGAAKTGFGAFGAGDLTFSALVSATLAQPCR